VAAFVGLGGGFVLLTGFGPGQFHGHMSPEKMDKFITFRLNDTLDDLNATPAQREKVLAVKDKLLADFQANKTIRQQTRQTLVAQWNAEKPDAKAVHDAIDRQIDQMRAFAHEAADQALLVHDILTPEQRSQVAGEFAHGPGAMMMPMAP
jgi:Spy/CpxP family protein refolding chaperone